MPSTIDTTTDAYADYVAVTGGMRPTDRARDRGITPATVSANVRRIRDAIANGATVPGDVAVPMTTPTVNAVDAHAIADAIVPGASMFVARVDAINADVARHADAVATLTARIDTMTADRDAVIALAKTAGFDFKDYEKEVEKQKEAATVSES
jgi:hypothetical protein